MEENQKRCKKCGELKPLSAFPKDKEMRDGYENRCKKCRQDRRMIRENIPKAPVEPHDSSLVKIQKDIHQSLRDVDNYASIKKQMRSGSSDSIGNIRCVWRQFLDYLDEDNGKEGNGKFKNFTPDQLLAFQKKARRSDDEDEEYYILDEIRSFINDLDVRWETKRNYTRILRSFFKINRRALPQEEYRIKATEFSINPTLTVKEINLAALAASRMYRAIILCRFQSAMDWGSFDYWNKHGWENLKTELEKNPQVIRIDLPGRSKLAIPKKFYTYIGPDAINALKNYLPFRKEVIGEQYIFYTGFRTPITKTGLDRYWLRILRRLGILDPPQKRNEVKKEFGVTNELTGKGLHEMRDIFRTRWSKTKAEPIVAEFMMGHVIDELGYNKVCYDKDWTLGEYKKALPWLNITSVIDPEYKSELMEERFNEQDTKIKELSILVRQLMEERELMRQQELARQ